MMEQTDIEEIIAERTRRRAEVQEFTRSLPALTPVQLPVFTIPLPRGAAEEIPCALPTRRTERNFRKRYARTHTCKDRMNAGEQHKLAQYYDDLEHLNFGYGTSPEKNMNSKFMGLLRMED